MTQEFVTLPREVVEQALEALFMYRPMVTGVTFQHGLEAMQALRAALDQPQANQPAMTPIAQRKLEGLMASGYTISGYSVYHEQKHQHGFVTGAGLVGWWKPEGVEYPQPKGEQEPVAEIQVKNGHWIDTPVARTAHLVDGVYKLYTHPQPKREPMTNEQIWELYCDWHGEPDGCYGFARAVEAAHNIK